MIAFARTWRALALTAVTSILATLSGTVVAQSDWPAKQVTMVVPFAPGGSTDVVARLLAQKLSEVWGRAWWSTTAPERVATSVRPWWPRRRPTGTPC